MRVIYHHSAGDWMKSRLRELESQGIDVIVVPESESGRFRDELQHAEVIWHVLRPLGRQDFECAPRLRLVQKIGVGVDTIDLDAARDFGIRVCNMPGSNSRAVAEMTLTLMFAAARRLMPIATGQERTAWWRTPPRLQEEPIELHGKTVGFVGFGRVPQIVAPVVTALGAEFVYTATAPHDDALPAWRDLPELLHEADILSMHLPLTPQTRGLIGRDEIAQMPPGGVLVNTSRGEVVDEPALIEALREGRLSAAGLDVFAREPIPDDHPLLGMPNVVATPHVAWQTRETMERSLVIAVENCRRLASGEQLLHQVA